MRHNVRGRKLNRTASHRKAMFRNMVTELFRHERIETTTAKAKEARSLADRLITYAKAGDLNSRRMAARKMSDPSVLQKLFDVLGPRYKDRPGGYTRVLKIEGNRQGDNAEMSILELVGAEFTPRTRRTKKVVEEAAETVEETVEEAAETTADAADAVEADDLTKVEGIGPKTAEAFQAAGIATFADLAAKEPEELKAILEAASPQLARFNPDTWPRQASMAAEGKWDELKAWQDELDGGKE